MSDDLVKRLRGWNHCWPAEWLEVDVVSAADRIEALEAERDAAQARADALAEKLKSIVDAWEWWQVDPYDRCQSVPQDAIDEARAVIAQIGDKTDGWECPINYPGCTKNCGDYGCGN